MSTAQEGAASSVAAFASKVTNVGAGTSGLGWMLSNEFIGLMGLVVAVIGLAVNSFFKARQDKRLQAEHEATMRRLTK